MAQSTPTEEAKAIFDGPVLTTADERRDYGEERFISIGRLGGLIVVGWLSWWCTPAAAGVSG